MTPIHSESLRTRYNTPTIYKTPHRPSEPEPDGNAENLLLQNNYDLKLDLGTRIQSTIAVVMECADTLFAYSFPKVTLSVTSDDPPSTHGKGSPTPEFTSLSTVRPVDEILPVHRINAPTPEATNLGMTGLYETDTPLARRSNTPTPDVNLTMAGLHGTDIPPIPLPRASSDNIEDEEQEELDMADITISITDSDSDSESATFKSLDSINVNSNSIPMQHFEREHVQAVFSSMRRSTKRSIDGNQEAADEGNRKEDDQDDEVELLLHL
ncbi:hypothetical protein BKA82DRAFT_32570 [Pisolithus tinctorius]|uniref:Uncharacterized protein n=1 Tax=Pisolithus tinctorius Marx 270 TaxID=870435 RepID=A0A0C3JHM5_PISTI|nr:hypothetical protein BKA82DRAFT_32570 [Pisolithus tinctorius]KIN97106.1 hypothetical protein M404DRAFT_32570 [Pisolithus tinctorius Marx 270]